MERPPVPLLVTVAAALLLFNAFTFGLAGVGNLFLGRNILAVAISPLELACCVVLAVGALQFRRGNRAWWRLLLVLVLLTQGQLLGEAWIAHHVPNTARESTIDYVWPFVWVAVEWTLLLLPVTRRYLDEIDGWRRRETAHAEFGHFAPAEPEQ